MTVHAWHCEIHGITGDRPEGCPVCHVERWVTPRVRELTREEPRSTIDAYLMGWLDAAATHERVLCVCAMVAWLRGMGALALVGYDLAYASDVQGTMIVLHNDLAMRLEHVRNHARDAWLLLDALLDGPVMARPVVEAAHRLLIMGIGPVDNPARSGAE